MTKSTRARKATKEELVKQADQAKHERDALWYALYAVCERVPVDSKESFKEEGRPKCRYDFALYNSRAPYGGIVIVSFSAPQQKTSYEARFFDEWHHSVKELSVSVYHQLHIVADRLFAARSKVYETLRASALAAD